MSKIPYTPTKTVDKARKKFEKELAKDKAAKFVYDREYDKEQEIRTYYVAPEPVIEEKLELKVLEEMKRKEEAKAFLEERIAKKVQKEAEEKAQQLAQEKAADKIPARRDAAQDTDTADATQTQESGAEEE